MKIHKLVLVALLLCLFGLMIWGVQGCAAYGTKEVKVEITYTNGEKEILSTKVWHLCQAEYLQNGCTSCIVNSRCGVRSVKVLR